ncbi:MAG: diaminopimelate decarboxylase [Deltaproteobacteria bacterium]|nr:diaminopimelate decarboxylase [Deltaproteobacteria bacterium]
MHHFQYRDNELYCEKIPVADIAANVKTPFYLYSHATLKRHFNAFDDSFKGLRHLTCFSMKSNSSMAILRLFSREGGGADIVSGGELYRALKAGIDPGKIVYSGVGKTEKDLEYALNSDILMFNVESSQELLLIDAIAERLGKRARVAIRINPDVDPKTHPYISTGLKKNKFGIDIKNAVDEYKRALNLKNLDVTGVSCHIGSQLTMVSPFMDAIKKLKGLISLLEDNNIHIRYLDLGGGLGITYDKEEPPLPLEYGEAIKTELGKTDLTIILEPGRVIMGNAGILVTKVLYTKAGEEKFFIIVDAAMNDLMRPTLYGSYHAIQPVKQVERPKIRADIVGPICESGDFLAKDREVDSFEQGDLIAVMSAGAYGFSMSSTYNSRPRVAEVMVKDDCYYIIRERESYEDLINGEIIPDFLL